MVKPFGIHVRGPLEPLVPGFLEELARQGYSQWSATSYLVVMGHLSRWLGDHNWPATELTSECVQDFVKERRARGYAKGRSARGMVKVLINYLRKIGVVPEVASSVPETHLARALDEFTAYLSGQRGLAQGTIHWYRYVVHQFLCTSGISNDHTGYKFEELRVTWSMRSSSRSPGIVVWDHFTTW